MFTITFVLEGAAPVTIDANANENLLDVARKANVAIDAPCSGNGACGKCRVRLAEGYLDSPQNRHISSEEYEAGWRLACCSKVVGDATIEVPDIASAYRSRMKIADLDSPEEIAIFDDLRDQMVEAGFAFQSDLSFLPLELSEPTLDDTMPVITGAAKYPEDLVAKMRAAGAKVDAMDCLALAEEAGSAKAVNLVLLGRLSHYFDLPEEAWQEAIQACVPPKFLELNQKAFALGKNA